MTSLTFARESFDAALLAELYPHFLDHWRELGRYPFPDIEPGFNESLYIALEAAGGLRVFTARDNGALVGYAVFFLQLHPHHTSALYAMEDMLYVLPARRGFTGARLIRFVERELAADGVQVITQAVPVTNDWSKLLERMGYTPIEQIYAKRLDRVPEDED